MTRALLALVLIAAPALAQAPLVLDHDMLTSLARTGSPGVRLDYTPSRVVLIKRYRVAAFWLDGRAEAVFVREDKRLRLALKHLSLGGVNQNASRFDEASAKLSKLVNVETAAKRVEVWRSGKIVYTQEIK